MATARVPRSATVRPLPSDRDRERARHLRVVRPEAARRLALRLTPRTGVVLTVLLFAALFAVAVSHALLIESQAKLDSLDEQVAREQARYERNRLDVADLESPDRIVEEARDRLGMVPAEETVWLTPDQPAPGHDSAEPAEDEAETPDTSWADVKPYLEPTP